MTPFHQTPDATFFVGDVRTVLADLPAQSVQCVITSPPYWNLRSYLASDHPDKASELGGESLHDCLGWARGEKCSACYVCHLREVAAALWRVLRDDGVLFWNCGDSYAGSWGNQGRKPERGTQRPINGAMLQSLDDRYPSRESNTGHVPSGLKPKDRCGVPERTALAFQSDGWTWRDTIHLCKVAPMPESVTDRTTQAHEPLFVFTKKARYFWDSVAVAEKATEGTDIGLLRGRTLSDDPGVSWCAPSIVKRQQAGIDSRMAGNGRRNPRSWMIWHPEPSAIVHFAVFPRFIPSFAIRAATSEAGCCPACRAPYERIVDRRKHPTRDVESERRLAATQTGRSDGHVPGPHDALDTVVTLGWRPTCKCPITDPIPCTVLDCFGGSGTTHLVARSLGRHSVYIDLSEKYAALAIKRLEAQTPMLPALALPIQPAQLALDAS